MNNICFLIIFFTLLFSQESSSVSGCTNPIAKNYNRDATVDDGSCIFTYSNIKGCTNPLAKNYNRNATQDDGSCEFNNQNNIEKKPKPRLEPIEIINGCMDKFSCNYNKNANEDDGSCLYMDQCNICGGDNSTCIDCLGVVNGSAIKDECGICDSNLDNDCIKDCKGDWGGTSVLDECGICNGDNSTCFDCMGVANGSAVKDECGICDSDPDNDCIKDCNGVWGGTAVLDECDVCNGDNSTCFDCMGTVNGLATKDECGICDLDPDNDCVKDCSGDWGGTAVLDECGVCNGDNSKCTGCKDQGAANYNENIKIHNQTLCDFDLVFEESSIAGYTDREYTKVDISAYFNYDFLDNVYTPEGDPNFPNFGLTFGYEGDIYKKNNFLLSYGFELMLGQKIHYPTDEEHQNFSLNSVYLSPIINIPDHKIAVYTRLGLNVLSSTDGEILFDYFKSWDYGFNAGIGIAFVLNNIRFLVDYNFHNIFLREYDLLDKNVGFHRFGISIYHNLISKLRDKK